jgi:signal transduction histidine kinase
MTMFTRPAPPAAAVPAEAEAYAAEAAPAKRPPAWSPSNWPVRWKVLAIVLIPLVLATVFGGLRVAGALSNSNSLRLAAARTDVIPAITKYMSALDVALLASSTGRDVEGATKKYDARKGELQTRLATDLIPDVRSGVSSLLNGGQALLDKVLDNSISLRDRVTTYAPLLLTAENVINASVQVDGERIRAQAQGLSRAVGARGQMTMQEILVTRGADLPEPLLRTAMITLAGTEPSTLFGMTEVLGAGSPDAKTLQQQMVTRMSIMSNPDAGLVNNPDLLRSIQTTDGIAERVVRDATTALTTSVQGQAAAVRDAAVRDAVLVLATMTFAVAIVLLVARALVVPLRVLRDGALKVAHTDLEDEIARVRAGDAEPVPQPLAVYTTEEIGQVAHAVDELHTQALLLAGDEARLRLLVNDMFETMSRRSRSLVDQQLSLIDRLERNEEDPERLDSLFRLDHLAARLRRNSANLLVLAGAQLSREQRDPVQLSTVVQAAVSEVEDYRRVQPAPMPDCTLTGAASGGLIHLLAELIDNALRYSPPGTPVRVSAAPARTGGVLLRVSDAGLGMNDSDRRIANMRLQSGGDVTPDNARHMGLFVVSRLAAPHGIRVRLRGSAMSEGGQGTTAEIYLPLTVFSEGSALLRGARSRGGTGAAARPPAPASSAAETATQEAIVPEMPDRNGALGSGTEPRPPVTLLPRRSTGSSGITDVPPAEDKPRRQRRELATPWWEHGVAAEPKDAPTAQPARTASNTSAFFSARSAVQSASRPAPPAPPPTAPSPPAPPATAPSPPAPPAERRASRPLPPPDPADDDVIYQRMLSEIVGDPRELAQHPDLDWKSVWDRGWVLAAHAEDTAAESRTDTGLPVRKPGARLVPGAANGNEQGDRGTWLRSGGTQQPDRQTEHAAAGRDPEAIRASISSHFGGVHSARSHASEDAQGPDEG